MVKTNVEVVQGEARTTSFESLAKGAFFTFPKSTILFVKVLKDMSMCLESGDGYECHGHDMVVPVKDIQIIVQG